MDTAEPWQRDDFEEFPTYQKADFTSRPITSEKWNLSKDALSL